MSGRRWALLAAIGLGAGGAVIVAPAVLAGRHADAIVAAASAALGRRVEVGQVGPALGLRPRLVLRDVRIVGEGGTPLATADAVRLGLRLRPLLAGRAEVEWISVHHGALPWPAPAGVRAGLPFETLGGAASLTRDTLVIEQGRLVLLGGVVTGRVQMGRPAGERRGFTAELTGAGLDLAALPDAPMGAAGRLEFTADVSGPEVTHPAFRLVAVGTGRFRVAAGRLGWLPIGASARSVVERIAGAEGATRLAAGAPDLTGGAALAFETLAGEMALQRGRLRVDQIELSGDGWRIAGTGSVAVAGLVDVGLRLVLAPPLAGAVLGDSPVRTVLADAEGAVAIPLRFRGPAGTPRAVGDPRFFAAISRAIRATPDEARAAIEAARRGRRQPGRRRR